MILLQIEHKLAAARAALGDAQTAVLLIVCVLCLGIIASTRRSGPAPKAALKKALKDLANS